MSPISRRQLGWLFWLFVVVGVLFLEVGIT
jgi:hypothetical protein